MQAPTIAIGPMSPDNVGVPDQDNAAAPLTRHAMPSAIRRSKLSWNTNQASNAVATPSSVNRSDAAAASVRDKPAINKIGPTIPPAMIAPASHGMSAEESPASVAIFPVIIGLEFYGLTPADKALWFGILILTVCEIGMIFPPVGLNVYIMNGLAKNVPMSETYKGVVPFLVTDFIRLALLIAFPSLSLWLVYRLI